MGPASNIARSWETFQVSRGCAPSSEQPREAVVRGYLEQGVAEDDVQVHHREYVAVPHQPHRSLVTERREDRWHAAVRIGNLAPLGSLCGIRPERSQRRACTG